MYQLILLKSLLGLRYIHILFVLCLGARMAHRLRALKPGLDSRKGEVSRPAVGFTKPPVKCVLERLSPRKGGWQAEVTLPSVSHKISTNGEDTEQNVSLFSTVKPDEKESARPGYCTYIWEWHYKTTWRWPPIGAETCSVRSAQ
jgi:hypothetical protein